MLKISRLSFLGYVIEDFEILQTGLYGFIGQNGSGKSTFFSILNQETRVEGADISCKNLIYLSNLESFDKNLRAIDYFKILSSDECLKAHSLSKQFGADSFIRKKIGKYSLGMLQQVAIILSCAVNSEIIIFDELHSGLDIKHLQIFFDILNEEKKEKIIILTSHHLEDIKKHCDKTFFLAENIEEVFDFSKVEARIMEGSK